MFTWLEECAVMCTSDVVQLAPPWSGKQSHDLSPPAACVWSSVSWRTVSGLVPRCPGAPPCESPPLSWGPCWSMGSTPPGWWPHSQYRSYRPMTLMHLEAKRRVQRTNNLRTLCAMSCNNTRNSFLIRCMRR